MSFSRIKHISACSSFPQPQGYVWILPTCTLPQNSQVGQGLLFQATWSTVRIRVTQAKPRRRPLAPVCKQNSLQPLAARRLLHESRNREPSRPSSQNPPTHPPARPPAHPPKAKAKAKKPKSHQKLHKPTKSRKAKKPRSREAKKPRSQEAEKPKSQEAKSEQNQKKTKEKTLHLNKQEMLTVIVG